MRNFVAAVALLATAPIVRAQTPLAVGGQFQVNTYTTDDQRGAAVAVAEGGDLIVVWHSEGSDNGDTSGLSVQGRRFASDGSPVNSQFQVNTYTTNFQRRPAVAVDAAGAIVVVWASFGSDDSDTDSFSIQGQRFAFDGSPAGSQFQVNTYTTNAQDFPAVAMEADGDFVVVWQSTGSDNGDTSVTSIQGQSFTSDDSPVGSQIRVNTYTTGHQYRPAIAADGSGEFIVIWQSLGSDDGDTSDYSIQAQRLAADGSFVGQQFQVNSFTGNFQRRPAVAMNAASDFVIVWESFGSDNGDTSGTSIQGQRFASGGSPAGSQFLVNSYTTNFQFFPAVAMDASGNFVVAWESFASDGGDTSSTSIQGQRFAADGSPVSFQFQVNSYTMGSQDHSKVALDEHGDFVVVWESFGSDDSDDSFSSIQGQRYRVTVDIGDRVWHDVDGNGVQDGGEPGVAGVTVTLYDHEATQVDQTETDAGGLYAFAVEEGGYYLEFSLPAGYLFTARDVGADDVDSDVSADGLTIVFSVGADDRTRDAGLITAPPTLVGDRVWLDADGDGLQSGGEAGVANVEVRLFREPDPPFLTAKAATLEATTVTDTDGYYSFTVELEAGESGLFYLEFVCASGVFTGRDQGGDDIDSDVFPAAGVPASGTTASFKLEFGAADATRDAGLLDADDDGVVCSDCDEGDPTNACIIFTDGFESGDTSRWSSSVW